MLSTQLQRGTGRLAVALLLSLSALAQPLLASSLPSTQERASERALAADPVAPAERVGAAGSAASAASADPAGPAGPADPIGRGVERAGSVHRAQLLELGADLQPPTDDDAELAALERSAAAAPSRRGGSPLGPRQLRAGSSGLARDFVVFGYLQSETQVPHLRWRSLTHVGSRFVGFDASGHLTGTAAFTGRSAYLKAGGAAQAADVRVVLVLANFDDAAGGSLATVMTSPARRATLVNELVAILAADSYSHGVSLDLEFSWGTAVRDGITAFTHELRAGLDTLGPDYELSIYTNAIFSSSQWNFNATSGITPAIDYMLYSMYDWASGSTAHAISDFDNCLGASRMHAYLNAGLPPEKLVPVISAYSRRWDGVSAYNGVGSNATSGGFTDALYDVTLNPAIGPVAARYQRGDEAGWYTWNDGTQRVRTFEALDALEVEVRHALSMRDPGNTWAGRRLGGVGFWSLMWMAEFTSIDPRTGGSVARTRTYPHIYQLCQEAFAPAGTTRFVLDGFDGLDPRWRDPNEARDTRGDVDLDSSRSLVPSLDGGALRCVFDFEGATGNRAVFAHELLASPLASSVTDLNAPLGHVDRTSRFIARVQVGVAQPAYSVRMLAVDAQGHLEASPPFALSTTGERELIWDLSDPFTTTAFATTEPAFSNGDGILDSFGGADIGFYGFVVEGDGAAQGRFDVDEVAYDAAEPGGRAYRINELRYADASAEFVELYGPAGPLPFGLELRLYDSSDGSVAASFPLFGAIPDDGGGFGHFVLGDPAVANVDSTFGFAAGRDDLFNVDPSALQLRDGISGHVYDSVVYEAFGGLDELTRRETHGVTANGWPWIGEVGPGLGVNGQPYSMGRYPDGADTRRNRADFSFLLASPGLANGDSLPLPASIDFEAPLTTGFQTYDQMRRVAPTSAGLPPSPNGGLAWRCVDTAGGGVIGALGDAALGATSGLRVSGEVYVPSASAPAQAIAVGIAGSQGSTFFTAAPAASGYESGYWLIYENRAGVQLADGRVDHPGAWELVHATHDNMDGAPVTLLATLGNTALRVVPGKWSRFEFDLVPNDAGGCKLEVRLNGEVLFSGALPAGSPVQGAFQVGFRENHAGGPTASEGTWVDGVRIERLR
ncbi:MAG: glycoside hydrolase family 18 protein [Planctomycetota bacterium]